MSLLRLKPSFLEALPEVEVPFAPGVLADFKAGDLICLTGTVYTGRDQTHSRFFDLLDAGKKLPVDLAGQLLYYVGPSPARPGQVIGAAGPTTSYRMDTYTPRLLELGLSATMGKGKRTEPVRQAMQEHGAVYLAAFGGLGAYLSRCIVSSELVAFADAGPEALFRFSVEKLPAVIINDIHGNDYYEMVRTGKN